MLTETLSPLYSNAGFDGILPMKDAQVSEGHCLVDIGAEEFTKGHPHAAIDPSIRVKRLIQEARDPETAIILMDVLLGYALNEDPAGAMVPAIVEERERAEAEGRSLCIIADLCGTDLDPQDYEAQKKRFEEAGVIVMQSNEEASALAARILEMKKERDAQ